MYIYIYILLRVATVDVFTATSQTDATGAVDRQCRSLLETLITFRDGSVEAVAELTWMFKCMLFL